jgi:hypothetical protein
MTTLLRLAPFLIALMLSTAASVTAQPTCLSDHQCADGDLCNGIERCVAGTCEPSTGPLTCDDGDVCTIDSCNPLAGCAHADVACPTTCGPGDEGLRCSDGTACTVGDTCSGGTCIGTGLACDDADPCTVDSCDLQLGCVYNEQANAPACLSSSQCASAADHTPCVGDGDPCTIDGCLEGACRIGLIQIQRQCSDNDACNGEEFCSSVKGCEPGPPPACDDGQFCNGVETCLPATGCTTGTPAADGTPCDDGQSCTESDACTTGTCLGTPLDCDDADAATMDLCLESTGCLHCAPLSAARLSLRFPAPARGGRFTASGGFVPATAFDPAAPAGTDLLIHDGATVVQQSHVAASGFTLSGGGTVARFVDRSGTTAQGLERLRIKTASPGARHQFSASGRPSDSALPRHTPRSLTLRAGATCATTTLSCTPSTGGTSDRCK